ncbi:serine protease, partial [Candidatus Kuenenbacteria bacterium]|nr:serine protease [Candidatus Kuenenbacteria bacterium]
KDQVEEEFLASPVITLDGKVAGLLQSESGLVTPIDHLTEIMKEVVQGQEWQQPYLGIKFYDLAEVLNPQVSEVKGAKIVNQGIKSDSPAKGILQAGDIILKIENEELSANKNLTELISQYKPGNSIRFWVKRGEDEQEFEITLK